MIVLELSISSSFVLVFVQNTEKLMYKRVQAIGQHKAQGLIGLHNFSGTVWGGTFVGISKKTWAAAYLSLEVDDRIIDCFRNLGEGALSSS